MASHGHPGGRLESDDCNQVNNTTSWYQPPPDVHNRSVLDSGIQSYISGCQSIEDNLQRLRIQDNGGRGVGVGGNAPVYVPATMAAPVEATMYEYAPVTSVCDQAQEQPSLEILYQQDEDGDTQLHLAIIQPNVPTALWLIESAWVSDYLNIQNNIFLHTPLHLAVLTKQPQIVRALVLSGASLTMRDKHGNTPLHHACALGSLECVQQLTMLPNDQERQYIAGYCLKHRLALRTLPYLQPLDMCLLNYEGETCLHLAQSSHSENKLAIINYLVRSCNADVNIQEGKCGYTILHQAVKSKDIQSVGFILTLPNVSVNNCCYNGCTAIGIASSLSQHQLVFLLRQAGAVPSPRDVSTSGLDVDDDQMEEFDDLTIGGQLANLRQ
jgi:NF-kappa-B inhibitor alpha